MSLAQVIVQISQRQVDRPFTYRIPVSLEEQIQPGQRVWVPFGARRVEGIVLEITPEEQGDSTGLKDLGGLVEGAPALPLDLMELSRWLAEETLCTRTQALQLMLPPGGKSRHVEVVAATGKMGLLQSVEEQQLLKELAKGKTLTWEKALKKYGESLLKGLLQEGVITKADTFSAGVRRRVSRPAHGESSPYGRPDRLSPGQESALKALGEKLGQGFSSFLLQGVTGSGKTEIYLQAIEAGMAKGLGAIVLVPEISLTPQTVERFRGRFGSAVAVMHSQMAKGERYREWMRLYTGEAQVVVGARSAVFAPVQNLGLIVVDEEHESAYKQEDTPKYHAREAALERARRAGCLCLLGSATPSLETYQDTLAGRHGHLQLEERVEGRKLPQVAVVDLREELKEGNRSIFSRLLQNRLEQALHHGDQALLFLNRRGFSTFVVCRECGEAVQCPHCAISMVFHRATGILHCHYCDHRAPVPTQCPHCQSKAIRYFGAGTQKVEEDLAKLFPRVKVLRMDADSTSHKGAHEEILAAFKRGEAQVLVGTQMITKGLDLPRVTLVGVLAADGILNLPDFRAAERTFQILTQVAGRAGRGERPGSVVIQTYQPEHYSVQLAKRQDFTAFAKQELHLRKQLGYPPFWKMIRLNVSGPDEAGVEAGTMELGRLFQELGFGLTGPWQLTGPAPAALAKIHDRFRWQLTVKGLPGAEEELLGMTRQVLAVFDRIRGSGELSVVPDVNPMSIF